MGMKQGAKSFKAYCEEALAMTVELALELESLLMQRWVNGLRNNAVSVAISMQQASWAKADRKKPEATKSLNITRTMEYARFRLGSASTETISPVSDNDKIFGTLQQLAVQQNTAPVSSSISTWHSDLCSYFSFTWRSYALTLLLLHWPGIYLAHSLLLPSDLMPFFSSTLCFVILSVVFFP